MLDWSTGIQFMKRNVCDWILLYHDTFLLRIGDILKNKSGEVEEIAK